MEQQLSRNNHYVPVWYQRQFVAAGASKLYRLDKSPEVLSFPGGRTVVKDVVQLSPQKCFCTLDLYTTLFGTQPNDEIERHLFGAIDRRGATAVRAFSGGRHEKIHPAFQDFFAYLDAQKLRTPKGLDWIKSRYPSLTQVDLMVEMQGLRTMHCTMWTEGVREIVSAERSDVKFIVSDHPVTIFNAACPPDSASCSYPDDPAIEQIGSQTVFVLDPDHCLILTNLEYAQNPARTDLTTPRTNARYRGSGLVRTDAFIRSRHLSRDEVLAINYLLKTRARRYVAASSEAGLFPERQFHGTWSEISSVLMPRDQLWQFGGEMYVGYEDGSTHYQDQFGRTSGAHEYLRKKRPASDPKPEEPCGCGSGHSFSQCCADVPSADRPSWDVYGIRERNLMFSFSVQDILGLRAGKTWEDVRRELSDEQVKKIHEGFGSLWPVDTDLVGLLPQPNKTALRVVYLGAPDPRTAGATIIGWLPYFDEIIVAHPFQNPARIKPEYSPVQSPSQYKEQTLKNVMLLLMLEPFIHAGRVHLVPDLSDFNSEFGTSVMQMAEGRSAGLSINDDDKKQFEVLARDDFKRWTLRMPEAWLRAKVLESSPELTSTEVDAAVAYMKREFQADPFALLQPLEPGEAGAQIRVIKGYALESALFLACATGAAIYTDTNTQWQQLHQHAVLAQPSVTDPGWMPATESIRSLSFPLELEVSKVVEEMENVAFEDVRAAFGALVDAVRRRADQSEAATVLARVDRIRAVLEKAGTGDMEGCVEMSVPQGGFERRNVTRLLLTFARAKAVQPVPVAFIVRMHQSAAQQQSE
jgi:uncharacterized protein YchJ